MFIFGKSFRWYWYCRIFWIILYLFLFWLWYYNIIVVVVISFVVDDGFYYLDVDILLVVFLLSFGVCILWIDYINNDVFDN